MNPQDIQTAQNNLIERIKQVQDLGRLNNLASITTHGVGIPQWHKEILDTRKKEYLDNPNTAIDFDQAMNDIEKDI